MDADQQLARWGISAGAHAGQVVVTMNADIITLTPEELRAWLYWAANALFRAEVQKGAADGSRAPISH